MNYLIKSSKKKQFTEKSANSFKLNQKGAEGKKLLEHNDHFNDMNVLDQTINTARVRQENSGDQWNKMVLSNCVDEESYESQPKEENLQNNTIEKYDKMFLLSNSNQYIWVSDNESNAVHDSIEKNVDTTNLGENEQEEIIMFGLNHEEEKVIDLPVTHKSPKKQSGRERINSGPVFISDENSKNSFHLSKVKIVNSQYEFNANISNYAECGGDADNQSFKEETKHYDNNNSNERANYFQDDPDYFYQFRKDNNNQENMMKTAKSSKIETIDESFDYSDESSNLRSSMSDSEVTSNLQMKSKIRLHMQDFSGHALYKLLVHLYFSVSF